jgi:hypothetical protein
MPFRPTKNPLLSRGSGFKKAFIKILTQVNLMPKAVEKQLLTKPMIQFSVDDKTVVLRGIQARLMFRLWTNPKGIKTQGLIRSEFANLPEMVAILRRKGIKIETKRAKNRTGTYVLTSKLIHQKSQGRLI